jgi:hypothetical protein
MERRLHRRGRDPIRLRDLRLEDEHEPDGDGDREDPVGDVPPGIREAAEQGNAHCERG